VDHLAAPERGFAERLLASLPPLTRAFVEARFIRNESYDVVAREFNLSTWETRSFADLAKKVVGKRMQELDRRGDLTRASGTQEWHRRFLAWAEFCEPGAVELPGRELQNVRGEFVARRSEGPSPRKRFALSMTNKEVEESGLAALFPDWKWADDGELNVFTLDIGVPPEEPK
jgi:hypothetical protein